MLQIVGALILLIAGFAILRLLFRAWYMPTALLRGIFHNVPDSCFRQWIK